ncbi:MAG: phosphotransferase, partial [Myxococcota bacterium]|nr:phosphotransferase [Myxococcota bacterium]
AARGFLAHSIRYTMRRWRRPLQWLAGTLLSTPLGLSLSQRPGIVVDPPIPQAADIVLLPGNQRVRLFDFAAGKTRVYAKEGFSNALMSAEIALRTGGDGPYPPILDHDASMTWFEEPILDGLCLARCPASVDPTAEIGSAFEGLDAWTASGARVVDAASHMEALAAQIRSGLAVLVERFDHDASDWDTWLPLLLDHATGGELSVGPTHGDCQHGNLMLGPDGVVTAIDWEHQNERWVHYDRMVFGLRARFTTGLPGRLRAYMSGDALQWHPAAASESAWREVAIARFLLEDALFYVGEASAGPYRVVTDGLRNRENDMRALGPALEALWRG